MKRIRIINFTYKKGDTIFEVKVIMAETRNTNTIESLSKLQTALNVVVLIGNIKYRNYKMAIQLLELYAYDDCTSKETRQFLLDFTNKLRVKFSNVNGFQKLINRLLV